MARLRVVGVMGSGTERHDAIARPLGAHLARMGVHLLTGGGGGVMRSVSEAFVAVPDRRGVCLGILPGPETRPGSPNDAVEVAIRTHLPLSGTMGTGPQSRNHINVLSADAIVALPGGDGTRSEVELALRYERPVRLHGPAEAFEAFSRVPVLEELSALAEWLDATTK